MAVTAWASLHEGGLLFAIQGTEQIKRVDLPYISAPLSAFSTDGSTLYLAGARQSQLVGELFRINLENGGLTNHINIEGAFLSPLTLAETEHQILATALDISRGAHRSRRGIMVFTVDTLDLVDFIEIPGALIHILAPQQRLLYVVEETKST